MYYSNSMSLETTDVGRRVWSLGADAVLPLLALLGARSAGAACSLVDAFGISGRWWVVSRGGSGERRRAVVAAAGEFWLVVVEESETGY